MNRRRRGRGSRAGRRGSRRPAGSSCRSSRSRGFRRPRAARRSPARRPGSRPGGRPIAPRSTVAPRRSTRAAVVRTSAPSPAPRIDRLALGQGGEEQRPMADRLVAGQARARPAAGPPDGRRPRRAVRRRPGSAAACGRHCLPSRRPSGRRSAGPGRRAGRRPARGRPAGRVIMSANWAIVIDCSPSDRASSGRGWTSTMIPSAPAATPARRHRLDQPALAGGVRRIDDHRQVGQVVEEGHGGQVERVARIRLERPDAPLAQDHVRGCPS